METTLSMYLLAPLASWAVSQFLKYIFEGVRSKSYDYKQLYKSGSMPSSHSALIVSLLTVIGFQLGIQSVEFAIVAVMAVIVLYDAVNVRRAVGEQGSVLARLLLSKKQKEQFYMAKGHTILEVSVGSLIGLTVAILMLQFL